MKKLVISFLLFYLFVFLAKPVWASVDDLTSPNNKFGIHLAVASPDDLKSAASLVNSSGGDWGYVTVVIEENDRHKDKWQAVFNQLRQLHLIPIVRLATTMSDGIWKRPEENGRESWVNFLDSLNWVVKNRYIVLFNEPNFNKEWGGTIDAQNYGNLAKIFSQKLKENNPDYFVMLAGFNATAPNSLPEYLSEENFLKVMIANQGGIDKLFNYIDGWVSHSYETNTYIKEINLLKRLGLTKELPVFITEAGWPHAEGLNYNWQMFNAQVVAQKMVAYFQSAMNDPQVMAITPFIFNYQGEPFDHFSWQKIGRGEFYPQFQMIQQMAKIKGEPIQEQRIEIEDPLPKKLVANSTYQIPIKVKNLGQAIWGKEEGYSLKFSQEPENFEYFFSDMTELLPFAEETAWLYLKTKDKVEKFEPVLGVAKEGEIVSNLISWPLETVPPLTINVKVNFFPIRLATGSDFKILIYNAKEEIVFASPGLTIVNSRGELDGVNNLIIGEKYRLVILKPYFLPRQEFLTVAEKDNQVSFKSMLPLDFNLDGKLSGEDLFALIKNPKLTQHIFW